MVERFPPKRNVVGSIPTGSLFNRIFFINFSVFNINIPYVNDDDMICNEDEVI